MPAHSALYCGMMNAHWGGGVRPAPVCTGAETGFLVSTSCYHGYERFPQTLSSAPASNNIPMELDCESPALQNGALHSPPALSRKRSGDESEAPRVKRLREEVHKERAREREGVETVNVKRTEAGEHEELERLLWSTHGASWFQMHGAEP